MKIAREPVESNIRVAAMAPGNTLAGRFLSVLGPGLDRVLGVRAMRRIYEENRLAGLSAKEFSGRVAECIGVHVHISTALADAVPRKGATLVVCNHPYGGMEAVAIIHELLRYRSDIKVLGNSTLRVFRELNEVMIFTDPLRRGQSNLPSLRQALSQLQAGGLLVIFPAGRVAYFRKDLGRTTDHVWDRIVGHLVERSDACVVPTFFSGSNSRFFLAMGYLFARLKILMLPREMLKMSNKHMNISFASPIGNDELSKSDTHQTTSLIRMLTYLQGVKKSLPPPRTDASRFCSLARGGNRQAISREIAALPSEQKLLEYRDFVVCFGTQEQLPLTVHEIARQRERTFRVFDEGSGEPIDSDSYDAHYIHLFVWEQKREELLGAYRMGQTDKLRKLGAVYLSQMFDFEGAFYDQYKASLELGRSFVTPEYQKAHYSLHLLWRGIGAYLRLHPRYRHLYGTVSLTRQYDLRSICVMCDSLIEPTRLISPRNALDTDLGPEWREYRKRTGPIDLEQISLIVRSLENGERDVPVLLRHYHKVGAKFLAVGIDTSFNNTPGLLLSVDIENLPEKKRRIYVDSK